MDYMISCGHARQGRLKHYKLPQELSRDPANCG